MVLLVILSIISLYCKKFLMSNKEARDGIQGGCRPLISELGKDVGGLLWRLRALQENSEFLPHFVSLQRICRRCYRGNLVSIHSYRFDYRVTRWSRRTNQSQVWIGGFIRGRVSEGQFSGLFFLR